MSAIAALRGYRTQFLYSLHYILSNFSDDLIFRLEGEEDLDVLSKDGQLRYAIQLKNLAHTITISDILSEKKTSFIKRFLDRYKEATPVLVSYGEISSNLLQWQKNKGEISNEDKPILKKYGLTADDWRLIKEKTEFRVIDEEIIATEIVGLMKSHFQLIDPIPTIGYVLNWLREIAEKQQPITSKDFFSKIEDFGIYLSKRIAVHEQYGVFLKPLHKVSIDNIDRQLSEKEFFNATLTRYEHILLGLDVIRTAHLERLKSDIKVHNTIIIKGASGQGKTALAYSYVNKFANDLLAFELNIQQDPINTQKAILAISSITDKLGVPAIFIINVSPNTTDWLRVVREVSHLKQIKFLIAIRNEDWYKATAIGIEFENKEIDVSLSKQEAETIYINLDDRKKIVSYTDFEEAWIMSGSETPLLEFVYSITQGSSLHNKLKQQVHQLITDSGTTNNQEIELLRIVSLADALGAKVEMEKLSKLADFQFVIEKLENEYLVRRTSEGKYIQGLHIVRSKTLLQILFDDFSNNKVDYVLKCIQIIAEEDLYLFLLQAIHLNYITTQELLKGLEKLASIQWSVYASVLEALIWTGTKDYVEANRDVIDECRAEYGNAWLMLIDFTFGTSLDIAGLLNMFNASDEARQKNNEFNSRLTNKETLFDLVRNLLNTISLPLAQPKTNFEWRCYGEVLFWLKNITHTPQLFPIKYPENAIQIAFKNMDCESLSKLMLGLYSHSIELDNIRKKYSSFFVERLKKEYDLFHVLIEDDEISVHYVIDVLNNESKRTTNDFSVTLIDLLRTAFPDKKKFSTQGHGHKLQLISSPVDDTRKSISIENLLLEEWVSINSSIIALYEFKYRPKDWIAYLNQLNQWENDIASKIKQFNKSFTELFKGSKTYSPTIPVLENQNFSHSNGIMEPQSITDPLGIYSGNNQRKEPKTQNEDIRKTLKTKYGKFFKSLSEFRNDTENFILQSAKTLASKIKIETEKDHIHDGNLERLSQRNLYTAITKSTEYNAQYQKTFGNVDPVHSSKLNFNELLQSAVLWKDFLTGNFKGEHSSNRIVKLKADFESRIEKGCKLASKANFCIIKYINNASSKHKPVLLIDSDKPIYSLIGAREAFYIVKDAIGAVEYTSLKYLMLEIWFSDFYFIQTSGGKSTTNQWNGVRLYNLQDKEFDQLGIVGFQFQPIDDIILNNLGIQSWSNLYPAFNEISEASGEYGKLIILVDHLYDLEFVSNIELNDDDYKIQRQHFENIRLEIQKSFQVILDYLSKWMEMFPYDHLKAIANEEEREYFNSLFNVKDYIFPEPREDDNENVELRINSSTISLWVERLKICSENWGLFITLLYGKYIDLYRKKSDVLR